MHQKVPKLLFSNFSKATAVISALALIFGIFCLCRIPKKQKDYQQAQAQYAIDLEARTREVSAEIDEYIKTGPSSMNDISNANVADGELYLLDYIAIIGPYATMETKSGIRPLTDNNSITITTYFYALYYTDSSNDQVCVILESFNDTLTSEDLPDTLYVRADLTPAEATLRDETGKHPTSYSKLQEIDPSAKCISLQIEYDSRDAFVQGQKDSIPRLAKADLEAPTEDAIEKVKSNAKKAFILAAILIPVTLLNMRSNAAKKEKEIALQEAFEREYYGK